jgi:IS30 family transposase
MVRRALSLEDRVVIAEGVGRGLTDREIGLLIGRDHTVVA